MEAAETVEERRRGEGSAGRNRLERDARDKEREEKGDEKGKEIETEGNKE